MKRSLLISAVLGAALLLAGPASSHEFDHPAPGAGPQAPVSTNFLAGGPGAEWQLVTAFQTGNPHTDLDFFSQRGEIFASVGTLAAGANGAGQSIVQLTEGGEVTASSTRYVSAQASAECLSNPSAATGLQHDVEATPKGGVLLNTSWGFSVQQDAQLIVDATDAPGRCHDNGTLGLIGAARGGLELVDITDVHNPFEVGLTSHIGQAHTVNIDPKRPHIAYAVTSDAISLGPDGSRLNEVPGGADRNDLDGFEVVDLSSCMNFPVGMTPAHKRLACRPQVYRYRFPSATTALGHTTKDAVYGCHELEVYPNDTLTCGSGAALVVLDMSGAFDESGKPKGTPLPCRVRGTTSAPPYSTGADVTDCVVGQGGADLTVPGWLALGAPSLEGVRYVGSVHHQGRGGPYPSAEDNDFNHEAEWTASGKFLLATDERGGGVAPPGATCATGVDNAVGNGGIHAYRAGALDTDGPSTAADAWQAYARTPDGGKAIYRATIRTGAEPTVCTAHVFHQIPGQNRIFMGWYSQGTQVVDFVERTDGSIEFHEAGWFIPEKSNTWTSAVFKTAANADGSHTYWGAAANFGTRNAIDVYKVTLPAVPAEQGPRPPGGDSGGGSSGGGGGGGSGGGGGGGGGAGGAGGGSAPAPPGEQPAPGASPRPPAGGVAGTATTQRRYVRGAGSIRAAGATRGATFTVNLAKGPAGKVVYRDAKVRFRNVKLASVRFTGKTVTLRGTGLVNGKRFGYVVTVADRGAGKLDTFRIRLANGYARGGSLTRGNVVVR
jgi:hypothetical protein